MGRVVIVAEKPSVARDIARVLKAHEKREGFLGREGVAVTWALGHLVSLCEPDELDARYARWSFSDLPILPREIPLKILKGRNKQFQIVKSLILAKDTDKIICATDSGREGELIFRLIYGHAKCKKPVERLWISSMTDEAIREGLKNLRPASEYDALYASALCRARADWLVGMNATRAYTLKYGTLLSLGRVQTPTLAILVKRQREIDAFIPQDFWEVRAQLDGFEAAWFDEKTKKTRLPDQAAADEIVNRAREKDAIVQSAEAKRKSYAPPLPPDLTQLQREANAKFGFTAQKTLSLAQDLYEKHKLITYPRTDSRYLTPDIKGKFPKILSAFSGTPYEEFARFAASDAAREVKRAIDPSNVRDHHAIIPTGAPVRPERLTQDERSVYDLVARHFLALFYPDRQVEDTELILLISCEPFMARGRTTLAQGYTQVMPLEQEAEQKLPAVKPGDELKVFDVRPVKGKTKPPAPHTEATLLTVMEHAGDQIEDEDLRERMKDCGLGTPATRAAIIERLIGVGYVRRAKKQLLPTEKGIKLIGILPDEITSAQTTGKWERALNKISGGEMEPERFIESIMRFASFLVDAARQAPVGAIERPPKAQDGKGKPQNAKKGGAPTSAKPPQARS